MIKCKVCNCLKHERSTDGASIIRTKRCVRCQNVHIENERDKQFALVRQKARDWFVTECQEIEKILKEYGWTDPARGVWVSQIGDLWTKELHYDGGSVLLCGESCGD